MATKSERAAKPKQHKQSQILVLLLVAAFMLGACGNKGELYLPENESQEQQSDES
ncbi:lipoprotein [Marinicella sp. S1101]|uniref:LPS translocon maturation chaperone LptM n=1 Tax=Marinicella marina TaxID=2996016 RepID=UPI002260BBD2|nr:lipoprotein [Marinicella marina]MCX7554372.1 lipoprotein [Marinicella marina]MDJ1138637.1 lipoprotein [Marinicella marina]